MYAVLLCLAWLLVPELVSAQVCGNPPTAACISQVGSMLWSDLVTWGAAALGLAVVAAGARWVMTFFR